MLNVSDLHLTVPSRTLVSQFSLEVPAGMCVAVIGPSGCGKTTLLRALAGLYRPARGQILIDSSVPSSV
jgi:ABC-type Fe3+/spermidine/putrescine transport system ATPase subunit